MTRVATPDCLPDDMGNLNLTLNGREYKGERRGDKFFVRVRSEAVATANRNKSSC